MIPAKNILFLCTGNSVRSVITKGILRHRGVGRYCGFSAGSLPTGKPNAFALRVLKRHGIETSFANPAVTVARSFTNTFSGIFLEHALGFIVAQLAAAVIGAYALLWLFPPTL